MSTRISCRRRDAVEGANGALKGAFVNIGQEFFKVFGLIKIKLLLAFALAAYNLETIRSFRARKAVEAQDQGAASLHPRRLQPRDHPLLPRQEGGRRGRGGEAS